MATLIIRDFDDDLEAELRVRAARHGRSVAAEAKSVLSAVLAQQEEPGGMAGRIRRRFADVGGVELDLPPRTELPRAVEFPE